MSVHRGHCWDKTGVCKYCPAERCCGRVIQYRRGKKYPMRCKARAFRMGLCMRCEERERQEMHAEAS